MKNVAIVLLTLLTAGSARLRAQGGNAGVDVYAGGVGNLCIQSGSAREECQGTWFGLDQEGGGGGFASYAPGVLKASAADVVTCTDESGCDGVTTSTYASSNFSDVLTFLNLQPGVTYNLRAVLEVAGALDGAFISPSFELIDSNAYLGSQATNCDINLQVNTTGGSFFKNCSFQIQISYDSQVSIGGMLQITAQADIAHSLTNVSQVTEMDFASSGQGSHYCYVVLDTTGRVVKGGHYFGFGLRLSEQFMRAYSISE